MVKYNCMLNIVNAKIGQISLQKCLNNIKELRKTGKVIVICPDRMALQIENKIFDTLKVSSLFDCDVYTMSRLSLKVLKKLGNNKKILTKQLAVTIIKKILLENNFSSFKNVVNFNGFALKLFEIISMFKSSKITPNMLLENTTNQILKEKLTDLNVVYEKYEEFLQTDYTDSFNKLDLFCSSVTDEFKNTHIIFVGFDDFTKQMLNIIKMFIEKSKSVTIATASSYGFEKEITNKNLFVNNVFYSLIDLCKANGLMYKIDVVNKELSKEKNYLLNNLYSYNPNEYYDEIDDVKIVSFAKEESELDFVLKDIKYKIIKNNLKYENFSICCPNLKERSVEIKNKFSEYNIPCFLDISQTLNETALCLYVENIFNCILNNFKKEDFLNLLKNVYSNVLFEDVCNFELFLNENSVDYVELKHCANFENIKNIYEHISILKNVKENRLGQFVEILFSLLNDFEIDKITYNLIETFNLNSKIEESKSYKMTYEKFIDALNELNVLLSDYTLSIENFYKILKVYLENVSITIPPIIGDVVMVYDINNSFVDNNDYMYILSTIDGLVPHVINDVSLISDNEINLFSSSLKLGPTCDLINKRNKFKVFENLFKFNKQLTISYYTSSSDSANIVSPIISNLFKIFKNLKIINGDEYISNYNYFEKVENKYVFELNNVSKNSAYLNFINLTKNFDNNFNKNNFNKYYYSLMSALPDAKFTKEVLLNNDFVNSANKLTKNIFFNSGTTSVSQIETYYSCPYKHFVRFGLNLKEQKQGVLMPNDIGTILHEFNSKIILNFTKELTDNEIENLSKEILDDILNSKYKKYVENVKNKNVIKNLYFESLRIAKTIYFEQQNSDFKNKYNEKQFNNLKELSVTKNGVTIFVKGFIDRIDVKDNMFALIDYKTGQDVFNYTDLYSGKKLQLLVYVKGASLMLNKEPVCACYLPLKNDFSKNDINQYKFKGIFVDSLSELNRLDYNLFDKTKSSVDVKINKDGSFESNTKKYCLSKLQIEELANFAFDLVVKAVEEILNGNIEPNPLYANRKSACEFCEYKGLCNFNTVYHNKYRFVENVASADEILNRGNNG